MQSIVIHFSFYTKCLSLDCSDDVDMTDHPPPQTTSAAVCLGGDGAVKSLYHLSNNIGSLFFVFHYVYLFLLIILFSQTQFQNSKLTNFHNSGKHQTPKRVDAPESTCRCGETYSTEIITECCWVNVDM